MNDWNGLTVEEPRLYNVWIGMIQRCENEKRAKYSDYGGRGITVCEEWHDFSVFVKWAKENGYQNDLTIDRINVNGNYEPDNCRWATIKQQANNKRTNVVIKCNGIKRTVKQWSELLNISPFTIYDWVNAHSIEYAEQRIVETVRNGVLVEPTKRRNCVKCGKLFEHKARNWNSKYCEECSKIAKKEKAKRYRDKKKANCGAKVVSDD